MKQQENLHMQDTASSAYSLESECGKENLSVGRTREKRFS